MKTQKKQLEKKEERQLVPITVMVTPTFKAECEREAIRLQYNSLSEMVRDKLRFCLPENIRNLIKD